MPIKIELHETIVASPQRVFDLLADLDGAGAWMKGLVQMEKLTQGPFGVGTRWREVRHWLGQKTAETFEVTAADPGQRVEVVCNGKNGTHKDGHFRFTYALESDGTNTNLTVTEEITELGWFGELMGRVFSGVYKAAMARDVRAMKAYLESTSG